MNKLYIIENPREEARLNENEASRSGTSVHWYTIPGNDNVNLCENSKTLSSVYNHFSEADDEKKGGGAEAPRSKRIQLL